jgi:hypothetical protein
LTRTCVEPRVAGRGIAVADAVCSDKPFPKIEMNAPGDRAPAVKLAAFTIACCGAENAGWAVPAIVVLESTSINRVFCPSRTTART